MKSGRPQVIGGHIGPVEAPVSPRARQRHIVHGHHQHGHGPILKKNRTNLETFAWYTGRLEIAVFDDKTPGGPLEILEVQGQPTLLT
jgi:hypothetical protein